MKIFLITLAYLVLKIITCIETNLETDDFQSLRLNSDLFVDKSMLMDEFLKTKSSALLIVRPSGWGKSANMDMLRRFFQPEVNQTGETSIKGKSTNGKLFLGGTIPLDSNRTKILKPLKIADVSSATQYMGRHPVIFVKLRNTSAANYEEILEGIKISIREAFKDHKYLWNSSRISQPLELQRHSEVGQKGEGDLSVCLYYLSWKLFEHFGQKVIVLIDDYDAPLINAYLRFGAKSKEFGQVLKLVTDLYQSTFNHNPHLHKGLLCGTVKVSLCNSTSNMGFNQLDISTLQHPKFSDHFGFTRPEVQTLLLQVPAASENIREINDWYSGYIYDHTPGVYYYNSRSIIRCLGNNGTVGYYGPDTNKSTGLVDKLLSSDIIQSKIQEIFDLGLEYNIYNYDNPISWNRIPIMETLVLNGYLRWMKIPYAETKRLIVPNKEANFFYATKVLQWVADKFAIDVPEFYSLAGALSAGYIDQFEKKLQTYLSRTTNYEYIEKLGDQANSFYINLMIALQRALASTHVTRIDEKEGDIATYQDEILMVPILGKSDTAIVINYKRMDKIQESLATASILEIASGLYGEKLKTQSHIKKLIKIGAAFCRDKVLIKHEIEDI
ncbi:uncharacterized protein LOC135843703 [Planococcus citri]|uniref:uncharacterized protein LOC135843703 n=1 Tax=Planococcus citri TaxID=170843 RepID=UPI0031F77ACF